MILFNRLSTQSEPDNQIMTSHILGEFQSSLDAIRTTELMRLDATGLGVFQSSLDAYCSNDKAIEMAKYLKNVEVSIVSRRNPNQIYHLPYASKDGLAQTLNLR